MKSKKWILIFFMIAGLFAVFYTYQAAHYTSHFLPNSTVNGVDIGGMTATKAAKVLQESYDSETFQILDNGSKWKSIAKTKLGVQNKFKHALKKSLSNQNQWLWWLAYFQKNKNLEVTTTTVNAKSLTSFLSELKEEIATLNETRTATTNATIKAVDGVFTVIPETDGDSIDSEGFLAAVKKAIKQGKDSIELEKYLVKATVKEGDDILDEKMDEMNKISSISANYSINGETITIDKATIMSFLVFDGEKVTVDTDTVKNYVNEIAAKYNTSTVGTVFASTKRGTVTVPAGTYSWTISPNDETAALSKKILAGEDFTRTPITTGSASAASKLIDQTYIEVDLVNQHMWYYKDGVLQLETDIISGKPSTPTPAGVFYVWKKEENATLSGEDYDTPVDYWMPIDWSGVGIHDSSWQTTYGGTTYETKGSHGCINTPPAIMVQLYSAVDVGTPVLVF